MMFSLPEETETAPKKKGILITPFRVIMFGFAGIILLGALLLMLPIASRSGEVTPFIDTLFTATSAVCVTGLIVYDTATHWTLFGQTVIILLIQIGGLGVVTVALMIAMIGKKRIGLRERNLMQEAIAAPKVGGIVRLTGFILRGTFLIELIGAVIMAPSFIKDHGLIQGLWMAVFHSISAFCNAGFDILGTPDAQFVSVTDYVGDPFVSLTICFLIIIGGIGFLTWDDIKVNKLNFKKYRMQSKVIITTTFLLLLIPTVYFFFWEFEDFSLGERLLASFFQSTTPRTAGFNTVDLTAMTQTGQVILAILMLIGGSPGGTAGGMKTTTLAVMVANARSVFMRSSEAKLFQRRIPDDAIKNAATIAMMYIVLCVGSALFISRVESCTFVEAVFETASAVGTVGLTLGITPGLHAVSKILLSALMFLGRVGGLTIIFAALPVVKNTFSKLPQEKIAVG